MSEERFEQTFRVVFPARLVVKNIRGSVDIQPGEDDSIHVVAVKHLDSGNANQTTIELTQDADGSFKAITRFPEGSIDWLVGSHPCKVDFLIRAPRQITLKISGVSNSVKVAGFHGDFSLNSVSGNLVLQDLNGPIDINTVSGGVDLQRVAGDLRLKTVSGNIVGQQTNGKAHLDTVSGNIRLKESTLPAVEAEMVSGNLDLQTPLGDGPYRFHSVSGEVRLAVPSDTSCSAELHSISGRIFTNLTRTSSSRHIGNEMVDVQGGGVKVTLMSVSGELSLAS